MIEIRKMISAVFSGGIKGHFGQWGEDVLVRKLFPRNKAHGIYLDIGAYHPFIHSNTAFLWMKGWSGYNVDANPRTIKLFEKHRSKDKNIWAAIVPLSEYENGVHQVSLMLPNEADHPSGVTATGTVSSLEGGQRGFSKSQKVPALCVSALVGKFKISKIDYLNIDIEGYDAAILSEIDLEKMQPSVVTVEDYSESFATLLSSKITKIMASNNYALAGRAGPTSVFLRSGRRENVDLA